MSNDCSKEYQINIYELGPPKTLENQWMIKVKVPFIKKRTDDSPTVN